MKLKEIDCSNCLEEIDRVYFTSQVEDYEIEIIEEE